MSEIAQPVWGAGGPCPLAGFCRRLGGRGGGAGGGGGARPIPSAASFAACWQAVGVGCSRGFFFGGGAVAGVGGSPRRLCCVALLPKPAVCRAAPTAAAVPAVAAVATMPVGPIIPATSGAALRATRSWRVDGTRRVRVHHRGGGVRGRTRARRQARSRRAFARRRILFLLFVTSVLCGLLGVGRRTPPPPPCLLRRGWRSR